MNKKMVIVIVACLLASSPLVADWEGQTAWSGVTVLSTPGSGVVELVAVQAGDRITRGQPLLRLEQQALRARMTQAQAQTRFARMQREEAGKELERAEELYERTLLADHELDLARIADAKADAAYQSALASEQLARQELAHSELRAPFDGQVLARHVQPGQTVVNRFEAQPMLVVAEAQRMLVALQLDAAAAATLENGMALQVEVSGQRHHGTVQAIHYLSGEPRPYRVQVVFAPTQPLAAGLVARVRLP